MIVAISGMPGSGKTTVGRIVAGRLGYKFYSIGDLRGEWAVKKGMTIDELNEVGERESWTDERADEYQKGLGEKEDDFVIDGRLSFHFIPHSFKVFLSVDGKTGAERIHGDERPDEKKADMRELMDTIEKRIKSDEKRYMKLYGIGFRDEKNYDLVIDTTSLGPGEVAGRIIDAIKKSGLKS